jgi:hypothetical protein
VRRSVIVRSARQRSPRASSRSKAVALTVSVGFKFSEALCNSCLRGVFRRSSAMVGDAEGVVVALV